MQCTKTTSKLIAVCFLYISFVSCDKTTPKKPSYTSWSTYLGDEGRSHYSTLSQITKENVKDLQVVWSYEAPDWGQMQMNPIVVDTLLYGVTAALRAFAVHAATGEEIWRFGDSLQVWHSTSRGVSYWENGNDKRILFTRGSDLYALDALTGKPIPSFGIQGKIDLRSGLPEEDKDKFVISNTPGTIYKDLIVMPLRISEDIDAARGDIMAFNVITGAVEWVFHTIPYPTEEGYETWKDQNEFVGAANNWAGMAVDKELGIIYIPTGSAAPDFYGGMRKGSNLFSDCLLALDANTGERIWHFQFTHHDIWDRDPPAPPNLLLVERKDKKIPAVAQVTKQGYVYVFDRRTGEPLFDIAEKTVPSSTLKGEEAWPTQPFPIAPKPFARQSNELTADDISPFAENREALKELLIKADKRIYAPPNLSPVLLLPGYDGAAEWGGTAADPEEGIIYVNSNEMAWVMQMDTVIQNGKVTSLGEQVYLNNCVICHKVDRSGMAASGFPSLIDIKSRKTKEEVAVQIVTGKGMMIGFPQIPDREKKALIDYLFDENDKMEVESEKSNQYPLPYKHAGYNKFLDNKGLPGISPPWGTLHAINLNTGKYIWSIPLGDTPELGAEGKGTGTENYGGPIVTENGLLFIGATKDGYFRVFDKYTSKLLWEYKLPAAAFATPAMYEVNGKQYISIACGGEKLGTEKGNRVVTFALK
ncbi:MAG: pyrroloquinoline quinone-dependent dehydrogenase [Maribacter sp.]|uniref:pyrroloquinoline quinone-dependent dehydrogenase n=1 Tax=Maribacter sp. TaxID=1897614 RepID=UPI003C729FA4